MGGRSLLRQLRRYVMPDFQPGRGFTKTSRTSSVGFTQTISSSATGLPRQVLNIFEEIDADGGGISEQEFVEGILQHLDTVSGRDVHCFSGEDMVVIFQHIDVDGSGVISDVEFTQALTGLPDPVLPPLFQERADEREVEPLRETAQLTAEDLGCSPSDTGTDRGQRDKPIGERTDHCDKFVSL